MVVNTAGRKQFFKVFEGLLARRANLLVQKIPYLFLSDQNLWLHSIQLAINTTPPGEILFVLCPYYFKI